MNKQIYIKKTTKTSCEINEDFSFQHVTVCWCKLCDNGVLETRVNTAMWDTMPAERKEKENENEKRREITGTYNERHRSLCL